MTAMVRGQEHLELIRFNGQIAFAGLPLVRFTTEARLKEIIAEHEDGCDDLESPPLHLEEGGMKQTAIQLALNRETDPRGLLNPGKMIARGNPKFDFAAGSGGESSPGRPLRRAAGCSRSDRVLVPGLEHGFPAILKGFVDNVFLPCVSFTLGEDRAYTPCLHNIKRLGVVCTCGGGRRGRLSLRVPTHEPFDCFPRPTTDRSHTLPYAAGSLRP